MPRKLEKALFMLRQLHKDVTRERRIYELSEDIHSPHLGEYYFIMTEAQMLSGHSQQFHFDDEDIPRIPTYVDVEERRLVYYPIAIGQYGLAIWHTYLQTRSAADEQRFLRIAESRAWPLRPTSCC